MSPPQIARSLIKHLPQNFISYHAGGTNPLRRASRNANAGIGGVYTTRHPKALEYFTRWRNNDRVIWEIQTPSPTRLLRWDKFDDNFVTESYRNKRNYTLRSAIAQANLRNPTAAQRAVNRPDQILEEWQGFFDVYGRRLDQLHREGSLQNAQDDEVGKDLEVIQTWLQSPNDRLSMNSYSLDTRLFTENNPRTPQVLQSLGFDGVLSGGKFGSHYFQLYGDQLASRGAGAETLPEFPRRLQGKAFFEAQDTFNNWFERNALPVIDGQWLGTQQR